MTNLDVILQIVAIAVVAAATYAFLHYRMRRTQRLRLQRHFGGEYAHVLAETGSPRRADRVLTHRVERMRERSLRALTANEQRRFAERWAMTQQRFVDTPSGAVRDAYELVLQLMTARGYEDDTMERRLDDLSVYHPQLVDHFRRASGLVKAARADTASTEQLRQAMVHYRVLVDELMEEEPLTSPFEHHIEAPRPV